MHKIHHEFDKLFSPATEYFHRIQCLQHRKHCAIQLPSALGFFVLRQHCHCFALFFWIGWKVLVANEVHSGYIFPCSIMRIIPLAVGADYHDYHHSHNNGNYGGVCYL
jgi:sterol desaturase/sphingolipid hydroxylase (fatty acid hydroxylase superfamily)